MSDQPSISLDDTTRASSLVHSSSVHSVPPCMKIEKSKLMKSQIKEVVQLKTDRSFTSIQMVHTHTGSSDCGLVI